MKGALQRVLEKCTRFYSNGNTIELQDKQKQIYSKEAYRMGCSGLRGLNDLIFYYHISCSLKCKLVVIQLK